MAWDSLLTFTETAVTASKNGASIDMGPTGMVELFVDVSSLTGTSPTLDIKIQDSADGSTWSDLVILPRFTGAGKVTEYFKTKKRYVRYVLTLGGTSPNANLTIRMA